MNGYEETETCWVCGSEKGSTSKWLDDVDGSGHGACGSCIDDVRILMARSSDDEFENGRYDHRMYEGLEELLTETDGYDMGLGPRLRLVRGGKPLGDGPEGWSPDDPNAPKLRMIG